MSWERLLIRRKLLNFPDLESTLELSEALFQKNPEKMSFIGSQLETREFRHKSDKLKKCRQILENSILSSQQSDKFLPKKISDYVSFLDLCWAVASKNSKFQKSSSLSVKWRTFKMMDFSPLPGSIYQFRKKIRRKLPSSHDNSVQCQIVTHFEVDAAYFRIVSMAKLNKSTANSREKRLCKKKPTFIVIFKAHDAKKIHPYFYSNSPDIEPYIIDAVATALGSSNFTQINFSGMDLMSLYRIRQNFEDNVREILINPDLHRGKENEDDPMGDFCFFTNENNNNTKSSNEDGDCHRQDIVLNTLTLQSTNKMEIIGGDKKEYIPKFSTTLEMNGPNILNELRELSAMGLLENDKIEWINELSKAGRNELVFENDSRKKKKRIFKTTDKVDKSLTVVRNSIGPETEEENTEDEVTEDEEEI